MVLAVHDAGTLRRQAVAVRDGRQHHVAHDRVARLPRLDEHQRELLRQLADIRDESRPEVEAHKGGKGVLGWLRETFK